MPNRLWRNRGDDTFQAANLGNLLTDGEFRATCAWRDIDNNGFLDLFIACGDGRPGTNQLFLNQGNGNHWLQVKLIGTTSNRDASGARIRVQATIGGRTFWQLREIWTNGGNAGGPETLAHFGLGNATSAATVRIEWPSGIVQKLQNVPADQFLTITEPVLLRLSCAQVAGGVRIQCQGEPHATYELQLSYNLKQWTKVQAITADAAGGVAVEVTPGTIIAQFYRALKR